jgi:hypothetical protein
MSDLTGCLPTLEPAYEALSAYASGFGITLGIADFGGLRTAADTAIILADRDADYAAALAAGTIDSGETIDEFRPISPFGTSYHNYGAAFDVSLDALPSDETSGQALVVLGDYAPTLGLVWGGRFTDPDPTHFELAMSLQDAAAAYLAMTGDVAAGDTAAADADVAGAATMADGQTLTVVSPVAVALLVVAAAVVGYAVITAE